MVIFMKALVYGAGTQGCELCHLLRASGTQTTLLVHEPSWKENLENNGLIIRHCLQRKTTVDLVPVITRLEKADRYDLIFVTLPAEQLPTALPEIALNCSHRVVIIGNTIHAANIAAMVQGRRHQKQLAFGYVNTGGWMEENRMVSVHNGVSLTLGGLHRPLTDAFQRVLTLAFQGAGCRLNWETHMDAWLKVRLAFTLPISYVCIATDFHLRRAAAGQCRTVLNAALEGCQLLRELGYPVSTEDNDARYLPGWKRKRLLFLLYMGAKTPLGRLTVGEYCVHAIPELLLLDQSWEELRARCPEFPMPAWDTLREAMPTWETLLATHPATNSGSM